MKPVLIALLAVLLLASAAPAEDPPTAPTPKIEDVRVWYYPPGGARPVTVVWFQPDRLRVHKRVKASRKGSFRVRVQMSGWIAEDEKGKLNWLSLVFRDENTSIYDLPHEKRETRGGVKDITWRVPQVFVYGTIEFQAVAWKLEPGARWPVTPVTSLLVGMCDRTHWLDMGVLVD